MRHLRNITDHNPSRNILSNRKRDIGREFLKFIGFKQFTQSDRSVFFIRNLNTNCSLAGNRRFNTDVRGRKI